MFYNFGYDIFLVKGGNKHAIYDFVKNRVFNIDNECFVFLKDLIHDKLKKLSQKEKETLDFFLGENILVELEKSNKRIKSINYGLKRNIRPTFAWLEITQQCNLRCVFCYEESESSKRNFMTMDDFRKAKNFLINYGIKRIQFIGGEPMLHKNLKEMIEESVNDFSFIEVYTNGTHLTQEWCDFFKKYNINLAVSFHSYIPEEYEKITQVKGSFEKVENGLKLIISNGLKFRVAAIGNKDVKIGEKPEWCNFRIRAKAPKLSGRCDVGQYDFDMFKNVAITKDSFSGKISKDFAIAAVNGHQCFSKNFYIAYNLEVFPCVMERRISHGFIKDENSLSFIKEKIFRKYSKDFIKGCKNCEFRYICHDCRPDSNNSPIKAKPWHCSYNPNTGEWKDLELMFKELNGAK